MSASREDSDYNKKPDDPIKYYDFINGKHTTVGDYIKTVQRPIEMV
jgi:hypothetical protein